ncbi:MAG TPA: hypothetical protein DCP38_07395 [Acidobacteria bacterium]|nr:hypothetical protein [Acidobacteriota bacterium]MDP6373090.1 hypothetical protein [Vicinamibacterales bacterium]HAK55290.1 hypothetical protein [Acidobacteriota bacterium]
MSPILVRPVREQFEHDRVIRLLLARWRRRFEVGVNLAGEPAAPLRFGTRLLFPDLVLTTNDRARRLHGVIEVETNVSINHLEAMAQWVPFARVRAPFHLYVPLGAVEGTRRLCDEKRITVDEIWSYHTVGSQVRFALAHRAPARKGKARKASKAKPALRAKHARKKTAETSVKSGRAAASRKKTAKPKTKAKKAAVARKTKSKTTRAAGSRKTAGRAKTRATTTSRRSTARKAPTKRSSRR